MKKTILLFLSAAIAILYFSCSEDNDNPKSPPLLSETFLNVSYGSDPQETYDLYLPENRDSEKTKVIALVHGGGWVQGDKADMDFMIPYIKTRHPNHAIVNINYVLADESTAAFPHQFYDLDAVINKLTLEKEILQISPQFALIGASAGAHLSLMYDYVYDLDNQVKMVGDIVGPADFTDPFYSENPNFQVLMAALVDESEYPQATNYSEILSPSYQVSASSSPTLLFYGNADPLVPLTNAITLKEALNSVQVDHYLRVYEGGHGNWSINDLEEMKSQISNYIDIYLSVN